ARPARRRARDRVALGEGTLRPSRERTRRPAGEQGNPRKREWDGAYPMRQIVLDTETTGLNPKLGDRIIEIGCVEVLSRRLSEREFHTYLNPEREVEFGATRVHGLTREDLAAKPKFAEIAPAFLDYIRGAELIIHNADFDVEFLNMELGLAGFPPIEKQVARMP